MRSVMQIFIRSAHISLARTISEINLPARMAASSIVSDRSARLVDLSPLKAVGRDASADELTLRGRRLRLWLGEVCE